MVSLLFAKLRVIDMNKTVLSATLQCLLDIFSLQWDIPTYSAYGERNNQDNAVRSYTRAFDVNLVNCLSNTLF